MTALGVHVHKIQVEAGLLFYDNGRGRKGAPSWKGSNVGTNTKTEN